MRGTAWVMIAVVGCDLPDSAPADGAPVDVPCLQQRWYPDIDGDGFGDPGASRLGCTPPAGHVATPGDCDDRDPLAHPDATETCNGIDDDCDAEVDEGVLVSAWVDDDGDGYGDADQPRLACPDTPATSVDPRDCDDTDPQLHPDGALQLTDVTVEAGLDHLQWDIDLEPSRCTHEPMAAGAAAADFDGDGLDDLYQPRMYSADLLFMNRGDGTFSEEAAARGIDFVGAGTGALVFDADGDGALDLFVTSVGADPARLYLNDGTGHFTEEAAARGVDLPPQYGCGLSFSASAGDADGDGDLDLHVTAWQAETTALNDRARLYLNDGAGFFTDATLAAGLDLSDRASFTSAFADLDDDGDHELLVAADWGGSALFENLGSASFVEVTAAAAVGTEENGMGSALGDLDNDGDADWFVTSIYDETEPCPEKWGCTGNRLYRNDGALSFTDITDAAGVRDGQWGWGAAWVDLDLDGWLDLVQAAGFPIREFEDLPSRLWRGDGDGTLTEVRCETGFVQRDQGRAVVPFDLDWDGDLDVFVAGYAQVPSLWRNDLPARPWLGVRLRDAGSPNTHGIGARVVLESGRLVQTRWIHANSTYLATSPAEARFGLPGGAVDRLEVRWPDGTVQVVDDVDPDQLLVIER